MIKFFRNIRKTMIKENKVNRYLLYAIGEIILVVIGILIALQINNWNESKKLEKTEIEFFKGVRRDLLQDKAYINLVIDKSTKKIVVYDILKTDLYTLYDNDKPKLDSLLSMYLATPRTFYPISGSFNSAMSSNEFNTFKNKALKTDVIKLYNSTYSRLMDNAKETDNRWYFVAKKYSRMRRTGHIGSLSPEQLADFEDDVFHHMVMLQSYINILKTTLSEIDAFLDNEQKAWQ